MIDLLSSPALLKGEEYDLGVYRHHENRPLFTPPDAQFGTTKFRIMGMIGRRFGGDLAEIWRDLAEIWRRFGGDLEEISGIFGGYFAFFYTPRGYLEEISGNVENNWSKFGGNVDEY